MNRTLTLTMRPKTFDSMIGVKRVTDRIRNRMKQGLDPAFMFVGETGSGKTTIARILALSLQCEHQEKFGNPCKDCRKRSGMFDISEINASDATQVKDLREVVALANRFPMPGSKYKVYILDEAQKMSDSSQNLMLKFLEDSPETTIWIVCTTQPEKLLETFRARCATYQMPSLGLEETRELIEKGLRVTGSDRDAEDLIEALLEGNITSPRKVLRALEKYLAGADAEEAAKVGMGENADTYAVCRALVRGQWRGVAKVLRECKPEDTGIIKMSVCKYLREMIVNSDEFSARCTVVSQAIRDIVAIGNMEQSVQWAGLCALLYELTRKFAKERA